MRAAAGHAQRGDLQAAGQTLEAAVRRGTATVHRGGGTAASDAPAGVPRLQVPSAQEKRKKQQTVVVGVVLAIVQLLQLVHVTAA